MKEILFTCPFTGCAFSGLVDADENLYVVHPLTGETLRINYNANIKKYNLDKKVLKWIATVTLAETADILGVSRQRASAIAQSGVITPKTVNGQTVFILDDVLEYKRARKVGAPRKEQA